MATKHYDLEHDKWLKKYRLLLIHAWRHGLGDREAAEKIGVPFAEYEKHLAMDDKLRQKRDDLVDELLRISEESVGAKIRDGDRQAAEWYLEHRHPDYGAKTKYEEVDTENTLEEKKKQMRAKIDAFMEKFKPTEDMFDGN